MSSIEKLSLQGVRSYGPNQKQVIEFVKPLTLILGANGSGKTTIIESLRMMTTGQLPPNAARGASFINDPKVSGLTEVKAQIRLRFRGRTGTSFTATRSFQLTNKKGDKQEYKALEANIVEDDSKGSASHRCADMDKIMPELMGVSPAILENVIFCHQEDSNWVLGEPKVLKEKFDAIFASTRYSKALDSIRKLQTEQRVSIKQLEGDKKELSAHKEQARKLRLDKEGAEEQRKQLMNGSQSLKKEMDGLAQNIKTCRDALAEYDKISDKRKQYEVERNIFEGQKLELLSKVEEEFNEDLDELRVYATKLMDKIKNVERDKQEVERQLALKNQEEQQEERKIQGLRSEDSLLKVENVEHKNKLGIRLDLARTLSRKYAIQYDLAEEPLDKPFTSSLFADKMKQLKKTKEAEFRKMRDVNREKQEDLATQLAIKVNLKENSDRDIQAKDKEIKPLRSSIETLKRELLQMKRSEQDLTGAKKKVTEWEDRLDKHPSTDEDEAKIKALEQEIKSMDDERCRKRDALRKQNQHFERMVVMQERIQRLSELEKQVEAKVEQERKSVVAALGEMPKLEELGRRLDVHLEKCSKKEQESVKALREFEVQLNASKAKKERIEAEVSELRKKICVEEAQMSDFEGKNIDAWQSAKEKGESLESAIIDLEANLQEAMKCAAQYHNMESMVVKYCKTAKAKSCCPLCERAFADAKKEVPEFVQKMQKQLSSVPEDLEQANEDIKNLKADLEALNQARNRRDQIESLKQQQRGLQNELTALDRELSEREKQTTNSKQQCKKASDSLVDIKRLERCVAGWGLVELEKLRRQVEEDKGDQQSTDDGDSRGQLEKDLERLESKIDSKRKEVQKLREKITENKAESERLMAEYYQARDEFMRLETDIKTRKDKERYLLEQQQRFDKLEQDVKEIRESVIPLGSEVSDLQDKREEMQRTQQNQENKMQQEITEITNELHKLETLEGDIRQYIESRKEDQLKNKLKEKEDAEKKLDKLRAERVKLQEKSLALVEKETKHSGTLRGINDNIELKSLVKKIESHSLEIQNLDDQVANLPRSDELKRQVQKFEADYSVVRSKLDKDAGGLERIEEQIRRALGDLNDKKYIGIDERHKIKHIELHALKAANKDLDKYYLALDKALMRFHEMKMEEINKMVKQYWQSTYKGDDIDTVEIKADLESAANRRSHNYRLVMRHRKGAELDMRGRCSAGQKVLASLVVRLALAETFGWSCGILALDEPTSNLDHSNIDGFTEALADIVRLRGRATTFQLLVISHDDAFIENLARLTNVASFYRIEKDKQTQMSRIIMHDVDTL